MPAIMDSKDEELLKLLEGCALKDQQALKGLYERLGPYLNSVAFRIVKSTELSNDVLQEAFVQVWTNAASYRPDKAKPLTWITSIVRYRALDRLEKEKKHQDKIVDDELNSLDKIISPGGPEEEVLSGQVSKHLTDCLTALNEHVRESIKLAYLYGYSREEIAERYETKVNTVKSWLRRGAERLKQCLEAKI